MTAKGHKRHDLEEPKSWTLPSSACESMRATWRQALLNAKKLTTLEGHCQESLQRHLTCKELDLQQGARNVDAIRNTLRTLKSSMKNRQLWHQAKVSLITAGHYREPLSGKAPMVAWFGGAHSLETGQTDGVPQSGITILLFSDESLRLVGLEMDEANSEWTYERLTSRIQALGWVNGIGIQCRIVRPTAANPVVTWPGDWHAYVVGDSTLTEEGACCALITTVWRPESVQQIENAKGAFLNMRSEEAGRRLEQLGFPAPVSNTTMTWLQDGATHWNADELKLMTSLGMRKQTNPMPREGAPPVEEPKKRAAP